MDFSSVIRAVQHNSLSWFLENDYISKCLSASHSKTGDTAVHLSCRFGRADLLAELSYSDAKYLEISNFEGRKPLHEAAQFNQIECVEFLLQNGCEVDCLKRGDWTPLMLGCTKSQLNSIHLLINHGANPALVNKDGWNSFHIATREGCIHIMQYLLSVNPNLWNTVSHNRRTPLHTAALHGKLEAVTFLLRNCSYPPDATDSCGSTPLMDALRAGYVDVADLLIREQKVDVTKSDNQGMIPIHHTAQAGQTGAVNFLVTQCGIHVDAVTHTSLVTPLHVAAKEGQIAVLNLLLSYGADPNLTDSKGRTALHIASGAQHASAVILLLENGAVDFPDLRGQWAKDLARREQVKQAFLTHGT